MIKNREEYLTSAQAALILGFTPGHVRRMIARGKIMGEKIGQTWLTSRKAIAGVKRVRNQKPKGE